MADAPAPPTALAWTVPAEHEGLRLDAFLAMHLPSRHAAQKLIAAGMVTVDGMAVLKAGKRLNGGMLVNATLLPAVTSQVLPENLPIQIIFEDEDLIVVNKAKGMVVHPAPGNSEGTLVNALLDRCRDSLSGIGGVQRPGIVHRLDKDTSGVMVVAKNDHTHHSLAAQIKAHTMHRVYVAIVHGTPPEQGVINAPLGRHPLERQKMAVVADGRSAITHFRRLESFGKFSLVELRLETGRTHQIRVHMSNIGFPVAGDAKYGPHQPALGLSSQALHAWRLTFVHPRWEQEATFVAELPPPFIAALISLRNMGATGSSRSVVGQR